MKLKYLMQYSASVNSVHDLLAHSMMQKLHGLRFLDFTRQKKLALKRGKKE